MTTTWSFQIQSRMNPVVTNLTHQKRALRIWKYYLLLYFLIWRNSLISYVCQQEENDSLRCQLEAYKNEVEIVRSDLKLELQVKEQHVKALETNLTEERLRSIKDKSTSLSTQMANSTDTPDNPSYDRSAKLISMQRKLFRYQQSF